MSGIKLEWEPVHGGTAYVADVGAFRLIVTGNDSYGHTWEVGRKGRREADFAGTDFANGDTESRNEAQAAAEAAAVDLLCSALAAFGAGDSRDFTVTRDRYASLPDLFLAQDKRGRGHPFFAMTDDECRRLAIALLAATRRDVK